MWLSNVRSVGYTASFLSAELVTLEVSSTIEYKEGMDCEANWPRFVSGTSDLWLASGSIGCRRPEVLGRGRTLMGGSSAWCGRGVAVDSFSR